MIAPLLALAAAAWLDVPQVAQSRAGCGSAAVAMVIQYWAREIPALAPAAAATERIDEVLRPDPSLGLHGTALKKYFEEHAFRAFLFNGTADDMRHHLDKGRPVIVCVAPAGRRAPLHYQVVVGLDSHTAWLNDSARGKLRRQELPEFLASWKATGNWALLAVPRQAP